MSTMAIPPFPPLDLAKLVLGYLAEEQLMTAYDEFLQASPFLDALGNEYDRIFMTSLKNILAEYRAVKIYVETCKPLALRRKLFQCTNLLDVVKFLVTHIDVSKLLAQDNASFRNSSDKQNSLSRLNACDVCHSTKISCICKSRQTSIQVPATNTHSTSNSEPSVKDSSVETTALCDLPGNLVPIRKKHVKTLDKDPSVTHFNSGCALPDTSARNAAGDQTVLAKHDNILQNVNFLPKPMDESQEKIQEFNDILRHVCNINTSNMQQGNVDRRVSNAGTFQDFATGMIGGDNRNIVNVPDCSTSENVNMQVPFTKELKSSASTKKTKRVKKSQIVVVANISEALKQPSEVIDVDAIDENTMPRIRPKDQNKVNILSDVKVGSEILHNNLNAVLTNATSTPLLKMQSVVINSAPVYKPLPVSNLTNQSYTKDEIMAMRTIIVTPLTGPPPTTVTVQPHQVIAPSQLASVPPPPDSGHQMTEFIPVSSVPHQPLGPLLIEVSTNSSYSTITQTSANPNTCNIVQQGPAGQGLVTTVASSNFVNTSTVTDSGKATDPISASVPKDNVIASATETSTPQALPLIRKSSSTPRRTSHVRVLDFTTPRRILHETINEGPNPNNAEIVLSKSPNIIIPSANIVNDNVNIDVNNTCDDCLKQTSIENSTINLGANKKDWDADLRALAIGSASGKTKRPKASRKKKVEVEAKQDDDKNVSSKKKPKTKKIKKDKTEISIEPEKKDEDVNVPKQKDIPKKPTINIISGQDWETSHQEPEKAQNKSNNDENDTPEVDRLCLEKAIGARLNISDLLETPYKQALYDIQMETPRFLGPDLPDDPMSDIKIMNIPTPRFLNSSKGAQATPSSYSSRPTDYSSGGSYYKPDDQDYMPLPEHIGYPASSQENLDNGLSARADEDPQEKANKSKSSRPVRQCAKNITYFNHQITKTKEESTKGVNDINVEELLSDSSFVQSSPEKKTAKESSSKKVKESAPRSRTKSDKGKRSVSKKYKSPLKKEVSKSFMKIRPRRSTPLKDFRGEKCKRKSSGVPTPKSQAKKRTTSKERNINSIPSSAAVPTKSRRKSSTPRKLHCTKTFNSESSGHNSPDVINKDKQHDIPQERELQCAQDSDTDQLKLRWSDDGSQDAKLKELRDSVANDSEDITKIQEYIETTICSKPVANESEGSLHIDLVKRGFDIETARIIERDLLDTPPHPKADTFVPLALEPESKNEEPLLEKTIESESSISNNLQIVQEEQQDEEEEEEEEIELSVHECNKDNANYITYCHDDNMDVTKTEPVKFKDKYSMEVCLDGFSIRLRATPICTVFDLKPDDENFDDVQDIEETQRAVSSIKFQTPLKDRIKAQCFEIFDSTLTSLDTPLKVDTPIRPETEVTVTEIVLEVENVDVKEKAESKKRKRLQSGNMSDDSGAESKKSKSEPQYMLNSANIQNIDIESVLSKLHGP